MRRLLVLRPEPGAGATVERARQQGLDVISVPMFEIEPISWRAPDAGGFDGLLLTSANAVRAVGERSEELRGLRVYAVGAATAAAAREAGFEVIAVGTGDVEQLLGSIDPDLRLLHLCGEDRRAPLQTRQAIHSLVVYRSKPIDGPDPSGVAGSIALIHSPRAGQRFAELVSERKSVAICAISPAAGEAVGDGWELIDIADQPTDEALLALAARLCNNPHPK